MKFTLRKAVIQLLLIFSSIPHFSQSKTNIQKQQQFYARYYEYQVDESKGKEVGNDMLKLSQTPYEKSVSYLTLGRDRVDNGDFVRAVDYLQNSLLTSTPLPNELIEKIK